MRHAALRLAARLMVCAALGMGAVRAAAQTPSPPAPLPPAASDVPPVYATLAGQPDPRDFVGRADSHLTLLGDPLRFGGFDIGWLGVRQDGAGPMRRPTDFEVGDALATVPAMGGFVVRSRSLAASVGCALCLEPEADKFNPAAFAAIDLVLKTARDLGVKVILPLAGGAPDCARGDAAGEPATSDAAAGSICTYVRWHGLADRAAFFTDPAVRADFFARVHEILNHVNALTGVAYRNDPAILAWENCEACGAGSDAQAVAGWVEALGQAIKAQDPHHLYENGAFAGRIGPHGTSPVTAAQFATPSVDIIGDRIAFGHDPAAARIVLEDTVAAATQSGRAYMLDSFGWGPGLWKTSADLTAMLRSITRVRDLAGVLVGGLQAHADQGGYLPAPAGPHDDGRAALYFPGIATADMGAAEMLARDRALRVFNYDMAGLTLTPAPLMTPQPEIVSAVGGHVVWRGAAGAAAYTIERSPDPGVPDSWSVVCDRCVTDLSGFWQDPGHAAAHAWYRVMPFNINGHKALPSDPVQAK